jgi:RHS repeat-associated protein
LAGFVPPTSVPSLTYDGTNRLTAWNGASLTYDANGNLTALGSTSYSWNARNQMTATSAGSASFSYDAIGRRVGATISGTTTPYLYDGLNPAMVATSQIMAGTTLDETYAQISSGGTTSFLRDGLNSTVALTNSSAAITRNDLYSPYGDSAGSGAGSTPFQYTGRENDGATGLYYYRARYYSPQLGRFISEDSVGVGGGTNYYAYVGDDPTKYIDPSGKFGVVGAGVGAVVGGVGDLAYQLYRYHGQISCVGWGQVAGAAAVGALIGSGAEWLLGSAEAAEGIDTAKEIEALNQQLKFQQQALNDVRTQLDNGRDLAARLYDLGSEPNAYGLGREINETLPAEIESMETRIQELLDKIRNLSL